MKIFLLLDLILFAVYNLAVLLKFKTVPVSLSETSYMWEADSKRHWFFSLMCISLAAILLPIWLEVANEPFEFLAFLGCAGTIFAGATPFFKEDIQKPVHYTGGVTAVVSGILWLLVSRNYWSIAFIALPLGICTMLKKSSFIYFCEVFVLTVLIFTIICLC